jgi:N-acylglucosamine-6-phosphate 2-epimerase
MMSSLLEKLKNGLLVSCQASPGWPFFGPENMQKMAIAAEQGGAAGLRACWPDNIRMIKEASSLPIVGVNKIIRGKPTAADVIITPNFEAAAEIIEAGCDILGIDCTARGRSWNDIEKLLDEIKKHYPHVPIMADISTVEEGTMAAQMGVDILSTTLSGYTNTSLGITEDEARALTSYPEGREPPPDLELIKALREKSDLLINAEGRFWEAGQVQEAFRSGANMVTVGTAITAPQLITKRFISAIREVTQN